MSKEHEAVQEAAAMISDLAYRLYKDNADGTIKGAVTVCAAMGPLLVATACDALVILSDIREALQAQHGGILRV